MRKVVAVLLLLIVVIVAVNAGNLQKTFTTRDEIYNRVNMLASSAGVIGASPVSPITGHGLMIALDRIDRSKLDSYQKREFDYLQEYLSGNDNIFSYGTMALDARIITNLQLNAADYSQFDYSNSSAVAYSRKDENLIPYRLETPFISGRAGVSFGSHIYLEGELGIRNSNFHLNESSLGWLMNNYNGKLLYVWMEKGYRPTNSFPLDFPYLAGGAFGNDYVSFFIGRYPHSMGSGITGNMMIGDNFNYQELAMLSFMNRYFSYNISVTSFDRENNISATTYEYSHAKFIEDRPQRVIHQFDVDILDRFRLTVELGTVFVANTAFDARFFYPFMLNHNYNNYTNDPEKTDFDEANNTIGFSIEAALGKGFTLHGQFVLDQMETVGEKAGDIPAAYGGLLNLKYSHIGGSGSLSLWSEFVYTNPYLYLNGKIDSNKNYDYNLDYIVGYSSEFLDDFGYSGYIFGPDSMVMALGGEFKSSDYDWSLGGSVLYRIKGEKGVMHQARAEYNRHLSSTTIDMGNATIFPSDGKNPAVTPSGGWDSAEHMIKVLGFATMKVPENNLEFYSSAAGFFYYNYGNNPDSGWVVKPVMTFGIKWQIIPF